MTFSGFPRDTLYTPTPDPLFGPLLEEIHDIAELKVTLRGLWLLHHKRQSIRVVSLDEFLADTALLRGLRPSTDASPSTSSEQTEAESGGVAEEIRRGLRLAVRRGVFLAHETSPGKVFFALNNDAGRRTIARLKQSAVELDGTSCGADEAPQVAQERPNIFALYEDTIGLLTPIIAERLKEAEERYPPGWIREAFEIAALENKRSWQYIAAILKRWGSEGKSGWKGGNNDDGKPGRHSSQNQRQKYSQDYQRRRRSAPSQTGRG